jgi:hypothetical protein
VRARLAVAIALLAAASARAQNRAARLVIDDCLAGERDEVTRIVGVELAAAQLPGPAVDVAIRCGAGSSVEIAVSSPDTAAETRVVDLGSAMPKARARLLALTVAEMVSIHGTPAPPTPPPPTPPPVVAPPPPMDQPPISPPPTSRFQLSAMASAHRFFSGGDGFLLGGGLRVAEDLRYHLGWIAAAFVEHGSSGFAIGTVSTDLISGDLGLALHLDWTHLTLRFVAGLRGGWVFFAGTPVSGATANSLSGPWLGPLGAVSLAFTPIRRLLFELILDGGYTILPVTGRVAPSDKVAIDGAWIGLQIAVGLSL